MSRLRNLDPLSPVSRFADKHTHLAAWLLLSTALCTTLVLAGREADLPLRTWLALFAAAVLTAGACVGIVGTGDGEGSEAGPSFGTDRRP
jgi:hypothetical protein